MKSAEKENKEPEEVDSKFTNFKKSVEADTAPDVSSNITPLKPPTKADMKKTKKRSIKEISKKTEEKS